MKLRKKQCATCPFLWTDSLLPDKMAEIHAYLLSGTNHLCHNDYTNRTICLGGCKFQLTSWHCLGLIRAATSEALAIACGSAGSNRHARCWRGTKKAYLWLKGDRIYRND